MEDPEDLRLIGLHIEKYSFFQEPMNRLMMYMKRHGMALHEGFLFSSQIPTSREQVNLVGAGVKNITVGDITKARDSFAIMAMKQLSDEKIITYR